MCQHLHVLPVAGALLDQDSFLVYGMNLVVEAQDAKRQLDEAQASSQNRTKAPTMG